ncbi:unnamed protein product [Cyprideis torosa]|uniref:Uncharacterized protein n=1 Tax=Cyprideis torosa TaxID=163714 RepID=A0A7R8ZMC4_9CRUS|nr:unnamed protein product [Cyprideis torosa]CAG0893901.1 unnamed protein product [Cyprideis torosa]
MFAVISFVLALCWCVYQIESADTIIFPPTNGESHQLPVIPRSPEAPEISTAEDIHSVFDIGKRSIHSEKKAGDVCFIPATGEDGICGDLKDCPPHQKLLSYILQHGSRASKLALDVLRNAICGYIKNVPLVCCPSASRRSQKPQSKASAEPQTPILQVSTTPASAALHRYIKNVPLVCCPSASRRSQKPHSKAPAEPQAPILQVSTPASAALHSKVEGKSNDRCGFSAAFHQRVVGGNPAAIGAWPWAALFYLKENQGRQSGAVAAFCGATLIDRSGWILTAAHCFDTNPEYGAPSPGSSRSHLARQDIMPLVKTSRGSSRPHGARQDLTRVVKTCPTLYRNRLYSPGDSGGGLFLEKPESYFTVIGVTSFGYKCAVKGFPGVYTRVSHFLPWIREVQTNYRLSQE